MGNDESYYGEGICISTRDAMLLNGATIRATQDEEQNDIIEIIVNHPEAGIVVERDFLIGKAQWAAIERIKSCLKK